MQINSYTADSLASGVKTTLRDESASASSDVTLTVSHGIINNSGADRFIAVAAKTSNDNFASGTFQGQAYIAKYLSPNLSGDVGTNTAYEISVLT